MKLTMEYVDSIMSHINKVLERLTKKYNTPPVKASMANRISKTKGLLGEYIPETEEILIYPAAFLQDNISIMEIVYHEFRHHYQKTYYPEIYFWFHNHEEYYRASYDYEENIIEADARLFGVSLGENNKEDYFNISINLLEERHKAWEAWEAEQSHKTSQKIQNPG